MGAGQCQWKSLSSSSFDIDFFLIFLSNSCIVQKSDICDVINKLPAFEFLSDLLPADDNGKAQKPIDAPLAATLGTVDAG
jgi:hypothetical protein